MFKQSRPSVALALFAAVVLAFSPSILSAQSATSEWAAALTGAEEVPANDSTATGTFTATLDEAAGMLSWELSVPSIVDATAAHLHLAAAGENGPVVLPLFEAPSSGPTDSIEVSGMAHAADITGPLAGDFEAFVDALNDGLIYANVHTTAIPAGEIRDQVAVATATATPGSFAATPVFSSGTPQLAQVVFSGGTVAQLHLPLVDVGADGAWAQTSTGEFVLYLADAPAFANVPFATAFPAGFPDVVALTLVRS